MVLTDGFLGPLAGLIDTVIADPNARDAAKLELLKADNVQQLERIRTRLIAVVAEAQSTDPWTVHARPTFLYVMYALLLWSIPMGLVAAIRPQMARDIATGMTAYLAGIPEPLYALFGTGYLGYTVARTWSKAKGIV